MSDKRARISRRRAAANEQGAQPAATVTAPRLSRRKRSRTAGPSSGERAQTSVSSEHARTSGSGEHARTRLSGEHARTPEPISLEVAAQILAEREERPRLALDDVAQRVRGRSRKRGMSLDQVAAQLAPEVPAPVASTASHVDFVLPSRPIAMELIAGRGHYERVIAAVSKAHTSVWIATANAKELLVDPVHVGIARRRSRDYVSILSVLDGLAERGVELRMLHAELPSGPFREELQQHPTLLSQLALRRCPRVHMKCVIIDGALIYLGSANWTGAGLGAKGSGKRNFELGFMTDDSQLLDQVQGIYDHLWTGGECEACKLREDCPGPLIELQVRPLAPSKSPTKPARNKLPGRSQIKRRRGSRLI